MGRLRVFLLGALATLVFAAAVSPTVASAEIFPPMTWQGTVKATDAASNLSGARAIVANVQNAVNACKQAYLNRQAWVARENLFKAYKAAVVVANKQHKKPPAAVADPGAEPPPADAMCPPSTVFGIAAADLNPAKAS